MKLIKCYVENFGKLHHFEYNFTNGFNSILELNGWGKTTFTTFIKAMFYGMEASRRKSVSEDERKKYMPWQGGPYGGYILFEVDDKVYKVERFFGESITGDSFTLYDNDTGLETHDYSENLGEDLFKLDREAYSRSAFIPQQSVEIASNDSISAKLSNLIESENDMNNFDPAKEKLERAKKEYIKTGGKGKIALAENRLAQLEEEKVKCIQKSSQAVEKNIEKKKIKERKERIKEEADESERIATRLLTIQGEMKPYELTSQEQLRAEILRDRFQNHIPSDAEIEERDKSLKTYHDNEIKLSMLKEILSKAEEEPINDKYSKGSYVLLVLIPIAIILGIVGTVLTKNPISIGVGVALAIIFAILVFASKSKQKAIVIDRRNKIDSHRDSISKIENDQQQIIEGLRDFLRGFVEHDANSMSEIENQLKDLRVNRSEYLRIMEKHSKHEELKNTKIEGHTLAEIQAKKRELTEEYDLITQEENKLFSQIEQLNDYVSKSPEIDDEIYTLRTFIKEAQNRYDNLSIAVQCLEKAKHQIAVHYMEGMQNGFKKYIGILDQDAGLEKNVRMDTELNVSVLDYGTQWSTEYFSAGYKDLIGICARFALIDALFEEERPFLILDDPFVNLDNSKLENALNLIKKVATQYQILYLTCHESRINSDEKSLQPIIELEHIKEIDISRDEEITDFQEIDITLDNSTDNETHLDDIHTEAITDGEELDDIAPAYEVDFKMEENQIDIDDAIATIEHSEDSDDTMEENNEDLEGENSLEEDDPEEDDTDEQEEKPKKKRGRPRKKS